MYVVSQNEVANAVLTTLEMWLDVTLAALELERDIAVGSTSRPSSLGVFRSLDWDTRPEGDDRPLVMVVIKPFGEPQRLGNGQHVGFYEIQVAAVCVAEDESSAIDLANLYGAAILGVIEHNGDLGGLVIDTWLISQAEPEFFDPTGPRRVVRATNTFRTKVDSVVCDSDANPEPDGTMLVPVTPTTINFTIDVMPITESLVDGVPSESETVTWTEPPIDDN